LNELVFINELKVDGLKVEGSMLHNLQLSNLQFCLGEFTDIESCRLW
jgi:hypothetical protein